MEAYRNYVSDSLALYTAFLTHGEVEVPRYSDMFNYTKHEEKPEETQEQILSRFESLRRKD